MHAVFSGRVSGIFSTEKKQVGHRTVSTVYLLVPPLSDPIRLLAPPISEFDLRALRTGVMAGSPCPIEVMKRLLSDMNLREMTICYGMTETSPVSTQVRGVLTHG